MVPLQISVEICLNGKKETLVESAPEGFPKDLLPHLADFLKRGFNAACERLSCETFPSLAGLALDPRGRLIDPEVERIGREAFKLHQEGLTYGQIARKVCTKRGQPGHNPCRKRCADRIRQAARQYENREYLRKLLNPTD
jgi:hypothetical protein